MRIRLLALAIAIFLFQISNAQWLQGKVLGERGERAAGISVKFTNSANTISTNPDGSFKIYAPSLPDTLVFSAIGYEPYTVVVTEKNIKDPNFEVVLLNSRKAAMEEVVVTTGYGTKRRKSEAVSSSAPLTYSHLPSRELSGSVAGLKITRGDYHDSRPPVSSTLVIGKDTFQRTTRILTAGEVNDFKKWKRWNDYSESEFKEQSERFGIRPLHRYTVQITNKKGKAIINERVFLKNKSTGATEWSAYTDNTGKAELWASFSSQGKDDGYIIEDAAGNQVKRISPFETGINFIESEQVCKTSNKVEIAFVVDATGSMGDEIEFLKFELEDVIRKATAKYDDLDLNTASVFYRDNGDEYVTKVNQFSNDMLKVLNFIKLQAAAGGGDYPEALDEALDAAISELSWDEGSRTRLMFLLLDAPPHESKMNKVRNSIVKAAEKGIRIIPVACSGVDKSTEFLLRSMALATNGTYAFLTNHSGVGNSHIEPTTDSYDVEKLNDLLQRVIDQYLTTQDCNGKEDQQIVSNNIVSVKLFPNPTSGKFNIESSVELKELFVTDFTGKILMRLSGSTKQKNWKVDLANYPSGTYVVRYVTGEEKMGSEKISLIR